MPCLSGTNIRGRTLTWSLTTPQNGETHEFMTAEFRKSLPWFVFVLGFIALSLVLFVILLALEDQPAASHYIDRIRQRLLMRCHTKFYHSPHPRLSSQFSDTPAEAPPSILLL